MDDLIPKINIIKNKDYEIDKTNCEKLINILNYLKKNYNIINKNNIVNEKQKDIVKTIEKEKIISNLISIHSNNINNFIYSFNDTSLLFYNLLDIFNFKIYFLISLYILKFKKYLYEINKLDKDNDYKLQEFIINDKKLLREINNRLFNHNCIYFINSSKNQLLINLENKVLLENLNNTNNITLLFNLLNLSIYNYIKPNFNIINNLSKNIKQLLSNNFPIIDTKTINDTLTSKDIPIYYNIIKLNNNEIYDIKTNNNTYDNYLKDIIDKITNSSLKDLQQINIIHLNSSSFKLKSLQTLILDYIDYLVLNDLNNDYDNLFKNKFIVKSLINNKYNINSNQFYLFDDYYNSQYNQYLFNPLIDKSKYQDINLLNFFSNSLNSLNSSFYGGKNNTNYYYYLKYLKLKQYYLNLKHN